MRVSLLTAICVATGLVLGLAHAFFQFGPFTNAATVGTAAARKGASGTPGDQVPAVVVEEEVFEFGKMEFGTKSRHDFSIRNEGTGPLKLQQGEHTCKCTLSELGASEVPPGESVVIALEWKAEQNPGPFRQSATILTNDPRRRQFTLTVNGEITQAVSAVPPDLVLTSIPTHEPTTAEVKVYAYHADEFEIRGHRFENLQLADHFEVQALPLPADDLKAHSAKGGALIKITVKPGLPLGPIRQKISLETNLERTPKVDIPVEGTVTSDISIIGQDWSSGQGTLRLGRVTSQAGASQTVQLLTRGRFRNEVEFKVARVWPEVLRVEIGEKTQIGSGAVSKVPLTIAVPKGLPRMNHWGTDLARYGEVVLQTNHPDVKEVKLLVQFAVE